LKEYTILLEADLTCVNISRDSRNILVNMANGQLQLIDIETVDVMRRYLGQKQGNFIISSAFGGAAENFVISGSEGNRRQISRKSLFRLTRK
jgi:hypothetical protein